MSDEAEKNLVPAIVQDWQTGEVLMLAYMDEESLKRTIDTETTWFWSRSRQQYWNKGETSGHKQIVKELRYDCDEDTYLVLVEQVGGIACHTGNRSCFYRTSFTAEGFEEQPFAPKITPRAAEILTELFAVIKERQTDMPDDSYTAKLLKGGLDSILAKVEEESEEVIEAAREKDESEIVWEASDLIYHLFVLLAYKDISLDDIARELERRRG